MAVLSNSYPLGLTRIASTTLSASTQYSICRTKNRTEAQKGCTIAMSDSIDNDDKGLIWKLPVLQSRRLGKLGPGFGFGAGCGVGFGIGLLGGAGVGPGIPGFNIGFGFGAGCGVGLGFGYGTGKGVAQDENLKHSNVGDKLLSDSANDSPQDEIAELVDELVINTRKLIRATSTEIDKWRK